MKYVSKRVAGGIAFIAGSAALVSVAIAGPIEERQEKMKGVGKAIGVVSKMAKGEADFDAAAALQAFVDMKASSEGFVELFPAGTETGGETEAAPAIFTDKAGFEAKYNDFNTTLDSVIASPPADLAALQASLGEVGKQCGACHKAYRIKKEQ